MPPAPADRKRVGGIGWPSWSSTAASSCSRGLTRFMLARVSVIGVPVRVNTGTKPPTGSAKSERNTARAPLTCGAAVEVPLAGLYMPPATDVLMLRPGASSVRKPSSGTDHTCSPKAVGPEVAPTLTTPVTHAGEPGPAGTAARLRVVTGRGDRVDANRRQVLDDVQVGPVGSIARVLTGESTAAEAQVRHGNGVAVAALVHALQPLDGVGRIGQQARRVCSGGGHARGVVGELAEDLNRDDVRA